MIGSIKGLRVADSDIMNERSVLTFLDIHCSAMLRRLPLTEQQDLAFGPLRWDELGREKMNDRESSHEGEQNPKIPSISYSQ